ncbi:UNVERIFIED_CONTAM: hypothetical protein Scaly_0092900 [Sesamum calycinum]|uniref:Reverse transcriptase domain-containing protein n=1 Tax=Sesamum calycinum TaxID=2727403 RepID=A0AAW2SVG8_9LAMI
MCCEYEYGGGATAALHDHQGYQRSFSDDAPKIPGPDGLNSTHIVLIPKCKHPEYLTQFRLISLCNVVYKIASKLIANRLKHLLDNVISPAQSSFVSGKVITDNILLAFELDHFLNSKTTSRQGWMALKLDVSKAYDKGDPLSPYFFLLCTELFSSLLQQVEQVGCLRGMKAKYFPNSDVFTATLGPRPSFTWRSVMAAYNLFQLGCRWQEGSGLQVRVWTDPWLPRPRLFCPITLALALAESFCVADLIDPTCENWDSEKARALFWPVDSEFILSIPLGRIGVPDTWVWHYSRNSCFSVQCAYHLACSMDNLLDTSSRCLADHQ